MNHIAPPPDEFAQAQLRASIKAHGLLENLVARTGLLPRVFDGKPLFWPWMQDLQRRPESRRDPSQLVQLGPVHLRPASQDTQPHSSEAKCKPPEGRETGWNGVVAQPSIHDLP